VQTVLHVFLDAAPWALPTTIALTAAALLLAPRCARRFGGSAFCWWFFLSSVGAFAAVTMTPAGGQFTAGVSGHVLRSWAPTFPSVRDLRSVDEVSLNVLVGVPMGAAITNLVGIGLGIAVGAAVLLARAVRPGTGAVRRG